MTITNRHLDYCDLPRQNSPFPTVFPWQMQIPPSHLALAWQSPLSLHLWGVPARQNLTLTMINTYFTIFTTFLSEMLHKSKLSSILVLLSNVIVSDYRYNKLLKIKDIAELQKKNSKQQKGECFANWSWLELYLRLGTQPFHVFLSSSLHTHLLPLHLPYDLQCSSVVHSGKPKITTDLTTVFEIKEKLQL